MVIVPLRCDAFGFVVALKLTAPLPLPVAPLVTLSHEVSLLTPVHEHPPGEVTAVEPVPPPAATDAFVGAIENVHGAAACVTVNVCPAIVSVPTRCEALGFEATLKFTAPFPLPVAPPVTVSHDGSLLAPVHAQPPGAVTVADPVLPVATMEAPVGAMENVHGAAACVTVNTWPATVIVPLRCEAFGFAVALKPTEALPLPVAPLVTVSHDGSLLAAVHAHPPGAVTAVVPVPPAAPIDAPIGAIE
jgi:hypothetical protein